MTIYDFIGKFILFVIPGFITCALFSYLTDKKLQATLIDMFYIFMSSLLSCLGANLLIKIYNYISQKSYPVIPIIEILSGSEKNLTTSNLIIAVVVSVVLALIFVYIFETQFLYNLCRKLHISNKATNKDVWDYLFDEQCWVIIRDYVSNNVYYGGVVRYSDQSNLREILLRDVKVISKKDGEYHMERVYLARNSSEFSIEVANYTETKEKENEQKLSTSACE